MQTIKQRIQWEDACKARADDSSTQCFNIKTRKHLCVACDIFKLNAGSRVRSTYARIIPQEKQTRLQSLPLSFPCLAEFCTRAVVVARFREAAEDKHFL